MIERLRAWARKHSERDRYTPVGIAFHWVMAALVIFQLGWGWYMAVVPSGGDKLRAFEVHSAVGLPILILGIGRFVWRMIIPPPDNSDEIPVWQARIAKVTHYIFYICFFGLPLSGWAMWSAVVPPGPLHLAGVIPWPQLPLHTLSTDMQWRVLGAAETVHQILVWTLAILVPAHVGAALKHHFWDRHDILRGIIPEVPDEPPEAPKRAPRPI